MQRTTIKIGDKLRNKTLNCLVEVVAIKEANFGMIHIQIKTPYGKVWCFPHDLEEP